MKKCLMGRLVLILTKWVGQGWHKIYVHKEKGERKAAIDMA